MTEVEKQARKAERLEADLVRAIRMEQRAGTRVKRAATILKRWQATRKRIERRMGEQAVRQITNRLILS